MFHNQSFLLFYDISQARNQTFLDGDSKSGMLDRTDCVIFSGSAVLLGEPAVLHCRLGLSRLCQHNFKHNRGWKA